MFQFLRVFLLSKRLSLTRCLHPWCTSFGSTHPVSGTLFSQLVIVVTSFLFGVSPKVFLSSPLLGQVFLVFVLSGYLKPCACSFLDKDPRGMIISSANGGWGEVCDVFPMILIFCVLLLRGLEMMVVSVRMWKLIVSGSFISFL